MHVYAYFFLPRFHCLLVCQTFFLRHARSCFYNHLAGKKENLFLPLKENIFFFEVVSRARIISTAKPLVLHRCNVVNSRRTSLTIDRVRVLRARSFLRVYLVLMIQ